MAAFHKLIRVAAAFVLLTTVVANARALLAQSQAPKPDKYALLVGITKYDHPSLNEAGLKFPEADVTAIGAVLEAGGYEVDYLLGTAATKEAIEKKLNTFSKRGGNSGVVFVGMFGHGIEFQSTKLSYFCPFDTEIRNVLDSKGQKLFQESKDGRPGAPMTEPDPESMISIDSILNALTLSKATNRVLVADCCRDDPNRARGRSFGSSLQENRLPPKTVALFACDANQQAMEHDDWGHGAMTKCLLEQLNSDSQSGPLLMGKLVHDVQSSVSELVRKQSKGQKIQQPKFLITDRVDLLLPRRERMDASNLEFILATCEGTSLDISADGTRILTVASSNDGPSNNFRVWDMQTGKLLHCWSGDECPACLSSDGSQAFNEATSEVIDVSTGETFIVDRLSLNRDNYRSKLPCGISQDFRKGIVGREIFDIRSGKTIVRLDNRTVDFDKESSWDSWMGRLRWSSDGKSILLASNRKWYRFATNDGRLSSSGEVADFLDTDGDFIADASSYKESTNTRVISIQDTRNGQVVSSAKVNDWKPSSPLRIYVDNGKPSLATLQKNMLINVMDGKSLAPVPAGALRFCTYGDSIITYEMGMSRVNHRGKSLGWARESRSTLVSSIHPTNAGLRFGIGPSVSGCSIDGRYCKGGAHSKMFVFPESNQLTYQIPSGQLAIGMDSKNTMAICIPDSIDQGHFDPESGITVSGIKNGKLVSQETILGGDRGFLSADGTKLVIPWSGNRAMHTIDVRTMKQVVAFKGPQSYNDASPSILSMSSDGGKILTAGVSSIAAPGPPLPLGQQPEQVNPTLWNGKTGDMLTKFEGYSQGKLSPSGSLAVLWRENRDRVGGTLWDLDKLAEVRKIKWGITSPMGANFSPDLSLLTVWGEQGSIELCSVAGRSKWTTELGNWIQDAVITSDNRWVVVFDITGSIKWLNIQDGRCELEMIYIGDGTKWVCKTPDNRFDVSEGMLEYVCFKRKGTTTILPSDELHSRLYTRGLMKSVLGKSPD